MNRYYLVIPIVFMAVFVFFERGASKEADLRVKAIAAEKAAAEQKKLEEKKQLEAKAKADSDKRNVERLAAEEAQKRKKKDEFDAKIQKLKDDAKKYTDGVELNNKLVASLEKDLAAKRTIRDQENRAVLELAKKVEITKKARRAAELEVQRYTEMLTTRANESAMAKAPVVATAENPAK